MRWICSWYCDDYNVCPVIARYWGWPFHVLSSICYRFTGRPSIDYKIEAEKFTGQRISRVYFKESNDKGPGENHILEKTMRLYDQTNPNFKCEEHLVYINVSNKSTKTVIKNLRIFLEIRGNFFIAIWHYIPTYGWKYWSAVVISI